MSIRLTALLAVLYGFLLGHPVFANDLETKSLWEDLPQSSAVSTSPVPKAVPKQSVSKQRLFTLDKQALLDKLDSVISTEQVVAKNTSTSSQFLELPLPSGETVKLAATEYSIMERGAKAFGDFRSWKVKGVDDPAISGVIDVSANGFNAMLLMAVGETVFINPENINGKTYKSYRKVDAQRSLPFQCGVHSTDNPVSFKSETESSSLALQKISRKISRSLKTYRLAMAATGEYTQFYGSQAAALNAISNIVNQLNLIYERDLGIRLQLVSNNAAIVFTDPDTDPYTVNSDSGLLDNNTTVLNRFIGSSAYDIGHVLTRFTRAIGGVAGLASVCGVNKGAGVTGSVNPSESSFAIDFVAHEIGHQLGATHTFNSTSGSCSGSNRQPQTAFEPGSGSSIMSYAGICGVNNIVNDSLTVFHLGSIIQINNNTRAVGDCALDTVATNQDPVINSTSNITVNAGESFTLTASASDPDGDLLTYAWDQFDVGAASDKFIDSGNNALFEVALPSSSTSRVFPGRALTNRNLDFELVVRDGKGGINSSTTTVTVINGSPPVTDLFPLSGLGSINNPGSDSGSGSVDLKLFLWLFCITLLVFGRKQIRKKQ